MLENPFVPILRYDARTGRLYRLDRASEGWRTHHTDITAGFRALFDLENIQAGWGLFTSGRAPVFTLTGWGEPVEARPSALHKRTFRLSLYLAGEGERYFSSAAKVVTQAIEALHADYAEARAAHPGRRPMVALTATRPVVSRREGVSATHFAPVFEIVGWADPAGL